MTAFQLTKLRNRVGAVIDENTPRADSFFCFHDDEAEDEPTYRKMLAWRKAWPDEPINGGRWPHLCRLMAVDGPADFPSYEARWNDWIRRMAERYGPIAGLGDHADSTGEVFRFVDPPPR